MKRLIDYFVSGMRTASFFYLSMMVLTQFYPGITYPEPMIKNILALFLMGGIMGVLTLILEKLEFLAFSIRVGVHLLVTATIFSIDLSIFWLGFSLVESLALVLFLVNLWIDMVVSNLANSQTHPTN